MSKSIAIFEVGPRDGLQNEPGIVALADKAEFIEGLSRAGMVDIEIGAFVRPDRVPQMADTDELFRHPKVEALLRKGKRFWALVPNLKGLERAKAVNARNLALFTAVSERFNEKNIGQTVEESLIEMKKIVSEARGPSTHFRVYVSTAFGCPFEGKIDPKKTLRLLERLAKLPNVSQISVGDTIGVATPASVADVVAPALRMLGPKKLALHFHDTRGTALANALRSIDLGVRILDSSAGGLGGCPFAPGATGNLATEDLVYMLNGMRIETGIKLDELCKTSLKLAQKMKRPISSRYLLAYTAQCERETQ